MKMQWQPNYWGALCLPNGRTRFNTPVIIKVDKIEPPICNITALYKFHIHGTNKKTQV